MGGVFWSPIACLRIDSTMMIRVKLVIISRIDGRTVSRLIRMRICSDSDSGRPSPAMVFTARSSAPGCPPADGAAVVEACEGYDAAAAALSDGAACDYVETDCAATGSAFSGCEAEARDLLDCWAEETTVDDCACDDADGFVCVAPAACDGAYDALTTCTNG